ncbi:ABC transporter permease/substrate-binding protein [Lacticaseibacillus mingshuiensis]|uniref:ABC transporter permease/substrate-binding protein n=1 Tax=Lacticaseibacillus mingshuiensis TaxID=2799574 RepID=A0ABW4CKG7_9LACO|nr:ABC transporter permease/substrate-binding protein [Lacticaseibacillus mingshuiensis]
MKDVWQTFLDQRGALVQQLGQHIELSLLALLVAVVIAVPLAIWAQPHKRAANFLLQLTGILQTIPSLAVLGLLIPLVGIGNPPTLIALVIYALLPIFQNTYVGLDEIDPAYKEAAEAFGMSRWRKLVKVELPLAMPVIIGGIRTAMVLIIGTATLGAFIGAGGLGTMIMTGINANIPAMTFIGALAAALLALAFSAGLSVLQKLRWRQVLLVLGAVVVGFGGYGVYQAVAAPKDEIVIAGKMGSEPSILINMYKLLIQQADPSVQVTLKPNFGQTSFLYSAVQNDKIDLYPEFTGTVVTSLVKPSKAQNAAIAAGSDSYPIAKSLLNKEGLTLLTPMKYNNTYAVVVTQAFAKAHNIKTISDLARERGLIAGFDVEFNNRQDGYKGLQKLYGLSLNVKTMSPDLRYSVIHSGKIQVTDGYSTDSQIRQYNLLALQDDKKLFPIYQGAPLMKASFAAKHPALVKALNKLGGRITETQMQKMNYEVNVQKRSAASVAKAFLLKQGLLKEAK